MKNKREKNLILLKMLKIYISDDTQKLNGSPYSPVVTWDNFSYQELEIKYFLYDKANLKQDVVTKPEN